MAALHHFFLFSTLLVLYGRSLGFFLSHFLFRPFSSARFPSGENSSSFSAASIKRDWLANQTIKHPDDVLRAMMSSQLVRVHVHVHVPVSCPHLQARVS